MTVFHAAHTDTDPRALRAAAESELASGVALPAVIEHARRGQAEHLRGQGAITRGLSDAARDYFGKLAMLHLPPGCSPEDMAGECVITPDMRRMFPELPEKDLLLVGMVDGRMVFEFANVESRP